MLLAGSARTVRWGCRTGHRGGSACLPHPSRRAFHHRYSAARRQSLIDIIAEGIATGELPGHLDPKLAALALLGPIFYRRLMSSEPFDPGRAGELVDTVLGPARKRQRVR